MRLLAATIPPVLGLPRWVTMLAVGAARRVLPGNPDDREQSPCIVCGKPVHAGDPYLRYRGEYYHGAVCVEIDPPAARRRTRLAGQGR